jgi:hypothetical protein
VADVNQEIGPPVHMAHLLNRANRRLRHDAGRPAALPDLNPAQARILDVIPAGGCRIVDLSGELRVSKQGLAPAGDDVVRGVRDLLATVEDRWRDEIGAGRYAVFRSVLEELVGRPPTRAGE